MKAIYKVTEYDVTEARAVRQVVYFEEKKQAADFSAPGGHRSEIRSLVEPVFLLSKYDTVDQLRHLEQRRAALQKLTPEERKWLDLPEPDDMPIGSAIATMSPDRAS